MGVSDRSDLVFGFRNHVWCAVHLALNQEPEIIAQLMPRHPFGDLVRAFSMIKYQNLSPEPFQESEES
ncbi:hypothetical protein EJB05_52451 [Eragrostis curvula]|uniref:Uncharacterized protein n=1 Tax=Eragrostis curvula TaxID=38414 RepID=A0A5J9SSX9_9POAL|nr:hypothetical protein EJB05_52451 [Eragrostis curvula]